jgi:4-amino-4-deoxy-L-arabinose transferase-like glycosyltransferase
MSERRQYVVSLSVILLVGIGLRAAVLAACLDQPIVADAASFYVPQGHQIFAGTYRGTYAPPLMGYLIATSMYVFGPGALAERMAGFIPSIITLVLTASVTRRAFGRRASLISTLVLACYPGIVVYSVEPRTEALAALWVVVVLGSMRVWWSSNRWPWMLLCGLGIGLAGLTRAPLLCFGPACVADTACACAARCFRQRPRRSVLAWSSSRGRCAITAFRVNGSP